ncbi:MAG TPA: NUDIX domain-containing protein [Gammaproteobacteria bacterium]|nr:NUDIX domain-containing protein [Gammaproteobacteria bacterium]
MSNYYQQIKIGVSVIVARNEHVLLAQRKGKHGDGSWDTPGGHLEPGETVISCAIRETLEESAIQLTAHNIHELGFTEDFFEKEAKHYISCVVYTDIGEQIVLPRLTESSKFYIGWQWFKKSELPTPLFIPVINAFAKFNDYIMLNGFNR